MGKSYRTTELNLRSSRRRDIRWLLYVDNLSTLYMLYNLSFINIRRISLVVALFASMTLSRSLNILRTYHKREPYYHQSLDDSPTNIKLCYLLRNCLFSKTETRHIVLARCLFTSLDISYNNILHNFARIYVTYFCSLSCWAMRDVMRINEWPTHISLTKFREHQTTLRIIRAAHLQLMSREISCAVATNCEFAFTFSIRRRCDCMLPSSFPV